jgi:hypothetical protein
MEMNRQDQLAAEQLDRYIDASQQGKATPAEYPFVDQLLAMARSIEAKPTLTERIRKTMQTEKVVRRPVRWAAVAAALVLVLAAFATVPELRSFARSIVSFFAVQETDQNPALRPTVAPPPGVTPEAAFPDNPPYSLTLDQIQAQVAASSDITFDVLPPSYLPADFQYDAGMVHEFGRMVVLTYVTADRLSLFHLRMYDAANPNPEVTVGLPRVQLPVGASSTIEAVTVNGQAAEYVQGDYGLDGAWDDSAPVQNLAWRAGDVLYVITTYEQNTRISKAELLAIAESIGP